MEIDEIDLEILKILQQDAKYPLERIAEEIKAPKSTIAYRIKRLERAGVIRGYHAYIDPMSLNMDYLVITLVKARYGKDYHEVLGHKIAQLPGVWGVYFVLGENDFIVLARFRNRDEMMSKFLEKLMSMPEVERTNTQVIAKVIKEAPFQVID